MQSLMFLDRFVPKLLKKSLLGVGSNTPPGKERVKLGYIITCRKNIRFRQSKCLKLLVSYNRKILRNRFCCMASVDFLTACDVL